MKTLRPILFLSALALLLALAATLPLESLLERLRAWTADHPSQALLVVCGITALAFIMLLPASLFMMLAGFLFGVAQGFIVVWVAGLLASTAAFALGRTLARPWIERRIRRNTLFIAIDRAVQRKGFWVVFLTRVVMLLPFPWLNYALGLTAVTLRDYLLGSNLGMVLPYFLFVYLGATASSLTALMRGELQWDGSGLAIAAMLFTIVLLALVFTVRAAARVLREELAKAPSES